MKNKLLVLFALGTLVLALWPLWWPGIRAETDCRRWLDWGDDRLVNADHGDKVSYALFAQAAYHRYDICVREGR